MINLILSNSMNYFQSKGLNPLNNDDLNEITRQLMEIIPILQSWNYDEERDELNICYPIIVPQRIEDFGEVVQGDFIMG